MNPDDIPWFTQYNGSTSSNNFYRDYQDRLFFNHMNYDRPTVDPNQDWVRVQIDFIYGGIRVTQVIPMQFTELEPLATRLEQMPKRQRDEIKKQFDRDMADWRRRNEPRYTGTQFNFDPEEQERRRREKVRAENAERLRRMEEQARQEQERRRQERARQKAEQEARNMRDAWEKLNEEFKRTSENFGGFTSASNSQPSGGRRTRARLAEIAGITDWSQFEDRVLLRRAQRKAHPDTGGTHELWLEVDEIRRYLKL